MVDFAALFEEDSVLLEIDEAWSDEELLEKSGMFRFAKVNDKLGINTKTFRQYLNRLEDPERVRNEFGIIQDGWWRVKMDRFRNVAPEMRERFGIGGKQKKEGKPDQFQELPDELSRDEFFRLRGIFRLKQIADTGFLPYSYTDILTRLKKGEESLDRSISGAWVGNRYWLVDMMPFLTWTLAQFRGISLEEAKKLVDPP